MSKKWFMTRSQRIIILLIIDTIFFGLELGVGLYVHSLALYADAIHMLNDVLSLVVALYAIRLAAKEDVTHARLSFGWQRAEILGALANGVFLLALCLSIFLEAMQRFANPPEIKLPVVVLIVGSLGLTFNIFGLFLFHEHGHGHDHGSKKTIEAGNIEEGPIDTILPENIVRGSFAEAVKIHGRQSSMLSGSPDIQDLPIHPAQTRQMINDEAEAVRANSSTMSEPHNTRSEGTPLLSDPSIHDKHHHNKDHVNGEDGHAGHSHGNLNMRGVYLHVLGDALGNIGVIATALFIWKTPFSWRFYFDPVISLVITGLIVMSAVPLCRSASFILLQATPQHIKIDDVQSDIASIRGVQSLHELHIWQLSDSKTVASVHIQVSLREGTVEYMALAKEVRTCLQAYGVESITIQPEFVAENEQHAQEVGVRSLVKPKNDHACLFNLGRSAT